MYKKISVTELDLARLHRLLGASGGSVDPERAEALEWKLSKANVTCPTAVPADLVTMNSTIYFEDEEKGAFQHATLSYPNDAAEASDRISVLAPAGIALLGLTPGQRVEFQAPGGPRQRLRVVAVPYQPEAAGDYHL